MGSTSAKPPDRHRARQRHGSLVQRAIARLDRLPAPADFRGLGSFGREVGQALARDRALDFAASVAFRVILGLFPTMLLAIAALATFGQTDALDRFIGTLHESPAVPEELAQLLSDQFEALRDTAPTSFTVGAIVSLGVALWALSSAARALMSGLNQMYGVEDPRQTVRRWLVSAAMAIGAVSALLLSTAIIVGGRGAIGKALGVVDQGEEAGWAWAVLRWPVLALLVLLVFSLAYSLAPHHGRKFQLITPGTLTAFGLWLVFAVGFSTWANNFADYGQVYGLITGVVVLMLYAFWSAVILFVGAEVDHVRWQRDERQRQPQRPEG